MADEIFEQPDVVANPPNPPEGDFKMPSVEELLKALEGMEGLSEENKQELKESLLSRASGGTPNFVPQSEGPPDMLILFAFLTIILFVFVFFGYKLYKSLTDRERRKEEKRRQKQQKKKK